MSEEKKFNPAKRKKLNNPVRLQWIPPQRIGTLLEMEKRRVYLDIGAGTGYISREVALMVPDAVIHALDIEPLMVEEMARGREKDHILPQLMTRDVLPFADASVDGIWSITVFHELGNPVPLLREIRRVLLPGGRLLIVDWEKKVEACEQGPPLEHRVFVEDVMAVLQEAGFSEVREVTGFTHHFGVLAEY
ncbi:methylase involved in ubiquinone/menaquinone biosynthesis [Desulfocapsa sulfexigens DSM 10523]|uniref:Methylase involved in ubiquinone/menaquinone biosynthesis n=1 Tax=Desulfocapsa sulfexigens (strain DSM 10523 / SB164P1) TaxID=1167006 RepID=M1NCZ4_DESSD|nr:class I SAM-dependent methyltransferase [Desulfocapsa sulfexigens]AGF77624.1 methylase involved in ubiquinone/menaquinone biosynthesis [Desulfocapsa sulfexigens DSM 10523]